MVSHIETCFLNWLWGVEEPIILLDYYAYWLQEVWTFEFYQSISKKVTLAGLNSLWQKNCQVSVKIWIFDDPIPKRDPYWSFWCQWGWNHQNQEVFWGKMAFEVTEAIALRFLRLLRSIRLHRYLRPGKSPMSSLESTRCLHLIIWWQISFYFDVWKK